MTGRATCSAPKPALPGLCTAWRKPDGFAPNGSRKITGPRARYQLTAAGRKQLAAEGRVGRVCGSQNRVLGRCGMSLWSHRNVLRGDRLTRDLDEELRPIAEVIEQGCDFAEPAAHSAPRSISARPAATSASFRGSIHPRRRRLRLASAHEERLRRSRVLSRPAIGACTSAFRLIDALFLRPLPTPIPSVCTFAFEGPGMDRRIGSGTVVRIHVCPCALRSGRADRHLLCGSPRPHLRVRPGHRKSILAICFGLHVPRVRTTAGARTPVHGERRSQARRAPIRRALA